MFTTLITITRKQYIINNAKRRRKFIEYTQIITKTTKFANMSMYNHIYFMYNDLNLEFRKDFSLSTKTIDINFFFDKMKIKKEI